MRDDVRRTPKDIDEKKADVLSGLLVDICARWSFLFYFILFFW